MSWIPTWVVTLLVAIAIAFAGGSLTPASGMRWFMRLQRPGWLTFERAIPAIWTFVFVCGAISAAMVWDATASWGWMGAYALLEVVTVAYTPVMCGLRELRVGTAIGGTGLVLCVLLAIALGGVVPQAVWLLVPYLLWSPIGTYTTWEMWRLNRSEPGK